MIWFHQLLTYQYRLYQYYRQDKNDGHYQIWQVVLLMVVHCRTYNQVVGYPATSYL